MAMWWRKSVTPRKTGRVLCAGLLLAVTLLAAHAAVAAPRVRHIRAVDADNHSVLVNRPGVVTALIGTSEDSQDAARQAGIAMYPFQGRPDFQLIVAVDLHDSLATWAPGIAISRMKSNLDEEAVDLKPYYLKNGNRGNPRVACHVIADFNDKLFTELGWPQTSSNLRAIVFSADGREYKRFDQLTDMNQLYSAVRSAIVEYLALKKAHAEGAPPVPVTRTSALSPPTPPLPPEKPPAPAP
jgi:hypothetical protein